MTIKPTGQVAMAIALMKIKEAEEVRKETLEELRKKAVISSAHAAKMLGLMQG